MLNYFYFIEKQIGINITPISVFSSKKLLSDKAGKQ